MKTMLQIDIQMKIREHMIHTSKENKIRNINKFFSYSSSSSKKSHHFLAHSFQYEDATFLTF